MITFAGDENNDWTLDREGNIAMLTGASAVSQTSVEFAKTRLGEMIHQINIGIPFFITAFDRSPNLAQFEAAMRRRLLTVPDVLSITALQAEISGDALKYTATLKTIYGAAYING